MGLCQDSMVHQYNEYCLKPTKDGIPRECRVMAGRESEHGKKDTDGFPLRDHHVLFTNDRGIKHLQLKRTKLCHVVQHSRAFLEIWRANCDVKLLIYESDPHCPNINEIDNVIRYLVAYASKKEKHMLKSIQPSRI